MIDPSVSLAFSVYSKKGAYALLLGSGISRASGIPTGWEVVLDLIRKIARLEQADCEPNPAAWYQKQHGGAPDYSKLLDVLAKTPTERQQLLRAYFEPTEDERAQNLKSPSAAHKAIAQLITAGYVRVVVTTNFDRLLERALEDVGVVPTVISTTDQVAGALPLAHSGITIIKLHGDYLDTRIKNTDAELSAYDAALDKLLDQVLDEYGLVICGWSADWDIALRAAINRCPSRRFSTFWATRGALSDNAKKLTECRGAEILKIQEANQFFDQLWEKVRALSELAAPHPLSAKIAVASIKRYLVDSAARIRLRDLVHEETEKLVAVLTEQAFPAQASQDHPKELQSRVLRYNSLTEILVSIISTGTYWGDQQNVKLWTGVLQRIVDAPNRGDGLVYLTNLRRYPALLLFYAAGIGALASRRYETLAALFLEPRIRLDGNDRPLATALYPMAVMATEIGRMLPGMERRHTPLSDYLYGQLRDPLREYLPSDEGFQSAFDRFEYLLGLTNADLGRREYENSWWGPIGCFGWRGRDFGESYMPALIEKEFESEGANWGPLKAGLFGGSVEHATTAISKFHAHLARVHFY